MGNEKISVLRKKEFQLAISDLDVGDQVKIPLCGIGDFTATVHRITWRGALFIFDECIVCLEMECENFDLESWIGKDLLEAFPDWLRDRISGLSIPTIGEFFGHEDEWTQDNFENDEDEQLSLMKIRGNRVFYYKNDWEDGWLRNKAKKEGAFAISNGAGSLEYQEKDIPCGIRPEFWLKV